jgi:Protein YTP1-like, C-terminal
MTDAGHLGPALPFMAYSSALICEGLNFGTPILRVRYVEPLFNTVIGLLVAGIHFVVIQKCNALHHDYDTNYSSEWTIERCMSVNGAHIGLGLYALFAGLVGILFHLSYWQRRIGYVAPDYRRQYEFLAPSVYAVLGLVMSSHEQDTPFQTMMHQLTASLSLVFVLTRALSYQLRGFLLVAGTVGTFAGLVFTFASENSYDLWMSHENAFGVPVGAHNVALLCACVAIAYLFAWLAFVPLFRIVCARLCPHWQCCPSPSSPSSPMHKAFDWIGARWADRLDIDERRNDTSSSPLRNSSRPLMAATDRDDAQDLDDDNVDDLEIELY